MFSICSGLTNAAVRQTIRKLGMAAVFAAGVAGTVWAEAKIATPEVVAATAAQPAADTVVWSKLPSEAQQTEKLIRAGGPFPYRKDGIVFGNRERLLPLRAKGHYREYTVKTPASRDRGARRIVCGGTPPTDPEACFYTADHYASFLRIVQ